MLPERTIMNARAKLAVSTMQGERATTRESTTT